MSQMSTICVEFATSFIPYAYFHDFSFWNNKPHYILNPLIRLDFNFCLDNSRFHTPDFKKAYIQHLTYIASKFSCNLQCLEALQNSPKLNSSWEGLDFVLVLLVSLTPSSYIKDIVLEESWELFSTLIMSVSELKKN
ncbi:hypothetical protein AAHE18_13G249300 [Arachis hypogaea]